MNRTFYTAAMLLALATPALAYEHYTDDIDAVWRVRNSKLAEVADEYAVRIYRWNDLIIQHRLDPDDPLNKKIIKDCSGVEEARAYSQTLSRQIDESITQEERDDLKVKLFRSVPTIIVAMQRCNASLELMRINR